MGAFNYYFHTLGGFIKIQTHVNRGGGVSYQCERSNIIIFK